jgi:carbon-monoxide dehydrogenase medium subunit
VKFPAFRYVAPTTSAEAVDALAGDEEARPLAGGQSLLPLMALRLSAPSLLVDLNGVEELQRIDSTNGSIEIGAMVRQAACERSSTVTERLPLLGQALDHVGHPAIRNRGTIGGSVAHADPSAELPMVMAALEATMVLQGPGGTRQVPAADYFTGHFSTDTRPGELLTTVSIPVSDHTWAFTELCRRHGDYALVMAAVGLLVEDGRCREARVVLGAVGDRPVRSGAAEAALSDVEIDDAAAAEAGAAAAADLQPPADVHASSEYRRQVAGVLVRRAILDAARRS